MAEKTIEEVIQGQILVTIFMYTIMASQWRELSDDAIVEKTRAFELEATKNILKAIGNSGFTIVRKEPALENYPSIT